MNSSRNPKATASMGPLWFAYDHAYPDSTPLACSSIAPPTKAHLWGQPMSLVIKSRTWSCTCGRGHGLYYCVLSSRVLKILPLQHRNPTKYTFVNTKHTPILSASAITVICVPNSRALELSFTAPYLRHASMHPNAIRQSWWLRVSAYDLLKAELLTFEQAHRS